MSEKLAYSVAEAARVVGVSRPTMYGWINKPNFPCLRIDGVVRIPVRAFEDWINNQAGVQT